jgi:hypothetical protein
VINIITKEEKESITKLPERIYKEREENSLLKKNLPADYKHTAYYSFDFVSE